MRASSSRLSIWQSTGNRPTNSGISPKSIISCASTSDRSKSLSFKSSTEFSTGSEARLASAAARLPSFCKDGAPKPKNYHINDHLINCHSHGRSELDNQIKMQTFLCFLRETTRSSPLKAPEAINRIWEVSTAKLLASLLIFLKLFSGTLTIEPSNIFNSP